MSGEAIAAEVKAALAEVGEAVGSGPLLGTIKRKGANSGTSYAPIFADDIAYSFNVTLGKFSAREREKTAVLETDTKITSSIGVVVPAVSDTIEILGVEYQIYGVDPLNIGGTDILYKIWARA
jgi:hypothetical protein